MSCGLRFPNLMTSSALEAGARAHRANLFWGRGISVDVETMAISRTAQINRCDVVTGSAHDGNPNDLDLVKRAARGDVSAFEDLYRKNASRIYLLCLRMCADPALAEEMAQEAFLRAWQKLGSFRGDSAFSTWLHRVTVNVVVGSRRSTARKEWGVTSVGDEHLEDHPSPRSSPGQTVDLERSIASLPEGARTVFVLHDVEGYRHREIAGLTGLAVGTSKAQLHRARKLLRKALTS
jgi:RNA polymerase sigma factor (sigma-70 family)